MPSRQAKSGLKKSLRPSAAKQKMPSRRTGQRRRQCPGPRAEGAGGRQAQAALPSWAHRARRRRSRCRPSGASQQAQGGGQVGRRKSTGKGAKTPRSLPNFLPQQNPHKIHTFGQKFICVLRKKNKKIAHRKICTLLKILTFKIIWKRGIRKQPKSGRSFYFSRTF